MKGLIIKDLYCLKKQFVTFAFIISGVVAVAIMFVLSEQYGNLRFAVSDMEAGGFDIASIIKTAVMFFMLLPIVCTGNIADSFAYDKAASFYKTGASLPVSAAKRVLSKFITALFFLSAGLLVDILMVAVISSVSDIIVFSECAGALISISACMLVYMSCVIVLCYAGASSLYSTFLPLAAAGIIFFAFKAKNIINALINEDVGSMGSSFRTLIKALETRPHLFIIAAVTVAALCLFVSVRLAVGKRGVV